mmetsp:Transcript_83439/g.202332  ORF Transcript_83439/g.202332 Transcript_83439/m.202332 type:complete len:786 (+) Transcript_83439:684-3041(+)
MSVPESLPATMVEVPAERKAAVQSKLLKIMDDHSVVAVFVQKVAVAAEGGGGEGEAPEPGQTVEAKYGNSFFEAEVLEVSETTVKVKYKYDSSEAELPRGDLKVPAAAGDSTAGAEEKNELEPGVAVEAKYGSSFFAAEILEVKKDTVKVRYDYDKSETEIPRSSVKIKGGAGALSAGQAVEAKFGNSFFEAEVVECGSETVKVKYKYDGSEADLPVADVKAKVAPPPIETELLRIFGEDRSRAVAAMEVYKTSVGVNSGLEASTVFAGKESDPLSVAGVSFVELTAPARVIGYKGAVKQKIERATSARIEVVGDKLAQQFALVAGLAEERSAAVPVIEMVQTAVSTGTMDLPDVLLPSISRVLMPEASKFTAMGKARATMNQLEEEMGVISFWATTVVPEASDPSAYLEDAPIEQGNSVEAKFGNSFFDAEVMQVVDDDTFIVKYAYDSSEAELGRAEIRRKLEGEALAAQQRRQRLAELATLAVVGPPAARRNAEVRVMAIVEAEAPGTFVPPGGGEAQVPLAPEDAAAVAEEVRQLEEKKRQEEQAWHEDKWEKKWDEGNKWEDDKKREQDSKWEQAKGWGEEKKWGGDDKKWDSGDKWGGDDKKWSSDDKWSGNDTKWGEDKKWGGDDKWGQWPDDKGAKRGWEGGAGDGKRQRTEQLPPQQASAAGSFAAPQPGQQPQMQEPSLQQPQIPPQFQIQQFQQTAVDPRLRLQQCALQGIVPTDIESWAQVQELIFQGHPPLPPGWIRVWSRSQDREYYVRTVDLYSVFDIGSVLASVSQLPG